MRRGSIYIWGRVLPALCTTLLLFSSCSCWGQKKESNDHSSYSGQTMVQESVLKFDKEVWDFGKVEEVDGVVKHTFDFVNKGSAPAVIVDVTTSCGCATSSYTKKPIKPNDKGEVTITFNPKGRVGKFAKAIYVNTSQEGGRGEAVLEIRGSVIPRPRTIEEDFPFELSGGVRINRTHLHYGTVEQGDAVGMMVSYVNTSNRAVRVEYRVVPDEGLFYINAPKKIGAGERGDISVVADATVAKDLYGTKRVKIVPIIDGKESAQQLSANAVVVEHFEDGAEKSAPRAELDPAFHMFGEAEEGKRLSRSVVLRNIGESTLKVRAVDCEGGVVSTLKSGVEIKKGAEVEFDCELVVPKGSEGIVYGRVVIVTNDPIRPVREMRLAVNVVK